MTDYTNIHDPFAHPYEYELKDIEPDIRSADQLTWRQKRIAQTVRDQLALDEGLALARLVLLYHDHYQTLTAQMSVEEHMRFDMHLLEAGFALKEMAEAWLENTSEDDSDDEE